MTSLKKNKLNAEKEFWNNKETVQFFSQKKRDIEVAERLKKIESRTTKSALDLGCGGGRHSMLLCELGFNTVACDANYGMVIQTQKNLSQEKFRTCRKSVVFGDILSPPFKSNFFDVIVVTGVLHQAKSREEYESAVSNLCRIAKTGAVICAHIFTNREIDLTLTKINEKTWITKEGVYMTLISKEEFYQLMEDAGITLEAELSDEIKEVGTGLRSVLKATFTKAGHR